MNQEIGGQYIISRYCVVRIRSEIAAISGRSRCTLSTVPGVSLLAGTNANIVGAGRRCQAVVDSAKRMGIVGPNIPRTWPFESIKTPFPNVRLPVGNRRRHSHLHNSHRSPPTIRTVEILTRFFGIARNPGTRRKRPRFVDS